MMIPTLRKNYLLSPILLCLFLGLSTFADGEANTMSQNDFIKKVSYLEIPENRIKALRLRSEIGMFDEVEYGCYQALVPELSWKFLAFGSSLNALALLLALSEFSGNAQVINVGRREMLIWFHGFLILASGTFLIRAYFGHHYPGFWFLTDKGLIKADRGLFCSLFFLNYSDMAVVRVIHYPKSNFLPAKRFLRIVNKEGVVFDYAIGEFVNEKAFDLFTKQLKEKFEAQRHLAVSSQVVVDSG